MTPRRASGVPREWRSRAESSLLVRVGLRFVELLRRPLRAYGVDVDRLREVLRVRLVLDLRTGESAGVGSVGLVVGLVLFFPAGLVSGIAALVLEDPTPWIAGSTAFLMALLGMLLLLQYAALLVDSTDVAFTASRPVSDRTLFAARLVHLTVTVGGLAALFLAGSLLVAPFGQTWWVVLLVYPCIVLLATVLCVGLVAGLFALLLRLVGPRHFQRVTLWVQVAGMTVLIGGGQLPNLLRDTGAARWVVGLLERPGPRDLLPPFQYAGLFRLCTGEVTTENLVLAGLAVALPALALLGTLLLASRHFVQALEGDLDLGPTPRLGWRAGWASRLGARVCRTRPERGAYDLAVACSRRDPLFLRQAVPGLIALPLMGAILSAQLRGKVLGVGLAVGMLLMALPAVLEAARYSRHDGARWLYRMGIAERPGELLRGGLKGLLLGALLPLAAGAAVLVVLIHGPARLPHAVVAVELASLVAIHFAGRWNRDLLFTRPVRVGHVNWEIIPVVFLIFACAVPLVGLHWLLCWYPATAWLSALALAPVVARFFRRLDRVELAPQRPRSDDAPGW